MLDKKSYFSLPVLSLVLLNFVIGTSEFVIVGILPDIASNINCSLSMAGYLVSIFAFAYAIGTPIVTAFISAYNRYHLLLCLVLLFILGNIFCAVAPNYECLIIARMLTAIVSGTTSAIALTFAKDITTVQNQPKVISFIFSGFSVATVFGVPIGTAINQLLSWRYTFIVLSLCSLLVWLFIWRYLPNVGKGKKSNLLEQFSLFKSTRIRLGMMIVIFSSSGTYVFYTYLAPILEQYVGVPDVYLSIVLSMFGFCTIISNLLSGKIASCGGMKKMPIVFLIQTIVLFMIPFTCSLGLVGLINILLVGVLMYLLNAPSQMHFLHTAKLEKPETISLSSSISAVSFNIGIAIGSASGSMIITATDMPFVGTGGAILAILAVFVNFKLLRYMSNLKNRVHLVKE